MRREQDRHMSLLHRNFNVLQSSLDASQHVLHSKLTHHLHDNATLLKEVSRRHISPPYAIHYTIHHTPYTTLHTR
ncbi:hypothetical protein EON63_09850 [archaeon]|nr:MAG: hypothetical protein EON63_09850 [archaeon]